MSRRFVTTNIAISIAIAALAFGQIDGEAAYAAFVAWRNAPENRSLTWEHATEKYSAKLIAGGMKPDVAAKTLSIISSRDEGTYYDPVYASPTTTFSTSRISC